MLHQRGRCIYYDMQKEKFYLTNCINTYGSLFKFYFAVRTRESQHSCLPNVTVHSFLNKYIKILRKNKKEESTSSSSKKNTNYESSSSSSCEDSIKRRRKYKKRQNKDFYGSRNLITHNFKQNNCGHQAISSDCDGYDRLSTCSSETETEAFLNRPLSMYLR